MRRPRKRFDNECLQELADSISQHGIIRPLTVRKLSSGYYQIIAGERRWRAGCGWQAYRRSGTVIEAMTSKAAELAMIENLQREDPANAMKPPVLGTPLMRSYHMRRRATGRQSHSAWTNALGAGN